MCNGIVVLRNECICIVGISFYNGVELKKEKCMHLYCSLYISVME